MQTNIHSIPKQDYLVLCSTITYQHAPYIEDTMNGFVMQQTSFPFACYIIDDASTDGEPEVIKAYLDKNFQMDKAEHYDLELAEVIVAKHNTNPNCTFAVYLLKRNLWKEPDLKRPLGQPWYDRAKYIALCEGDDYWTDPHKLQKQVDFLEEHEEYVMCFSRCNFANETGETPTLREDLIADREYTSDEIYHNWMIPTASVLYRREEVERYPLKHPKWQIFGDITLFLRCAAVGKIYGMSDKMTVYRLQPNSVVHHSSFKDRIIMNQPLHDTFLYINFPKLNRKDARESIAYAYYRRMKYRKGIFSKLSDLLYSFCWSPSFMYKRIKSIVCRNV